MFILLTFGALRYRGGALRFVFRAVDVVLRLRKALLFVSLCFRMFVVFHAQVCELQNKLGFYLVQGKRERRVLISFRGHDFGLLRGLACFVVSTVGFELCECF